LRSEKGIMKKAVITGITGQDGSYLSKVLLDKGYEVYGIVRDSTATNLANLKFLGVEDRIELIPANLLDLSNVIRLLDKTKPDEIYNLAAQSSVAISFDQPIGTIEFNVLSTLNLLEAIRILHLEAKFYQASSSEMHGRVKTLPVTEKTVLHPVSPYAISKATGHWIAINYREVYGLFCCSGILFNHESVLRPRHFVTKKIIATAVRISKGSQEKLRLGNIEIKRDWGYAPEYVKAMWLMLQQDYPDDYVIATNEAHSLKEFVELAFASLGLNWEKHVIIDKSLYRPSDIDIIYGSSKKAKERLGWVYNISFDNLVELLVREELKYGDIIVD
jgi:GDPmannose 4,6-dehydratase